jgi:hypothetical protein
MVRRYAAKADRNQPEIVAALRERGATVFPLHTVGAGMLDLLVGYKGRNLLMEVKDGELVPSAQKLTPKQVEFTQTWLGQWDVVNSIAQAVGILDAIDSLGTFNSAPFRLRRRP